MRRKNITAKKRKKFIELLKSAVRNKFAKKERLCVTSDEIARMSFGTISVIDASDLFHELARKHKVILRDNAWWPGVVR